MRKKVKAVLWSIFLSLVGGFVFMWVTLDWGMTLGLIILMNYLEFRHQD